MKITTIGVIGANGHVGANVVRLLIKKGYKVKTLIYTNSNALQGLDVELCNGDINNASSLNTFMKDIDAVIHCAGFIGLAKHQAKTMYKINVDGTKNVVTACLKYGIKKVVYVSSVQSYKVTSKAVLNELAPFTINIADAYSFTKYLGEQAIRDGIKKGLDACIVNPTSIIGPYDFNAGAQTRMIVKIANSRIPALMQGGFDWVDVRDVAQGILGALLHGKVGENYLLSGHWRSLKDLAFAIANFRNDKAIRYYLPIKLVFFGAYFVDLFAEITRSNPVVTPNAIRYIMNGKLGVDNQKAVNNLKYKPRPFNETMQDTMEWLTIQNWIKRK